MVERAAGAGRRSEPVFGLSSCVGPQVVGALPPGGEAALTPPPRPAPGPLATFPPAVAAAVLADRRAHPLLGARRAHLALAADPALAGQPLPSPRTIHRAWGAAGLVAPRGCPATRRRPRRRRPPMAGRPATPSGQIDHQDHLRLRAGGGPGRAARRSAPPPPA